MFKKNVMPLVFALVSDIVDQSILKAKISVSGLKKLYRCRFYIVLTFEDLNTQYIKTKSSCNKNMFGPKCTRLLCHFLSRDRKQEV